MISGLVEACLGGLVALAAGVAGAKDLDSLLESLAREPPQAIPFVEIHHSPLLEHDLVVSGTLEYPAKGRLSRVVEEPYRERTDIDGSDVRIQREGHPERRFSLRRSAELGGLLSAFSALLGGDRATLEASFEPTVEFRPGGWQLDLVPKHGGRQDRVDRIRVQGIGNEPYCIDVLMRDGGAASRIRLGTAAKDPQAGGCTGAAGEE
jgi:Outer membrane lipoprotein carrier protein LolA-like